MFNYVWPLAVVVISNTVYHICAKSAPESLNPAASLVISYGLAMVMSFVMFLITSPDKNLIHEVSKVNWASIVMGISIVGLEIGYLYAYKNGWQVSTAAIVQSAVLAVILLAIGSAFFKETVTVRKLAGLGICLAGLYFINKG